MQNYDEDTPYLVEKRDYNFPAGRVRRVRTVTNLGREKTSTTETAWFEKKAGETQFTMVEKLKISSKRNEQVKIHIPANASESLAAAKNAAKQSEYMVEKARKNFEETNDAIESMNNLFTTLLGIEFQPVAVDGDDQFRDGIRITVDEPVATPTDSKVGDKLVMSDSAKKLVDDLTGELGHFEGVEWDDYWSEEV